ncbi:serine/threonine protein kinase [Minicystis rosea]|nr:serine/threonine protein kinase [Minicystis rosea]
MTATLRDGAVVGGRFRLVRPIGEGGMGSIWQAREEASGRSIALKLVHATRDSELFARFVREARIIRQFSHPNVVGVLDAGELTGEGLLFMAMELLHGSPLSNHLRPGRPMPPVEILPVLVEVCRGLEAAHSAGVIHRDMKPENVFLAIVEGKGVVPKILDFGLSTAGDGRAQNRISMTGQVLGTPAYMSPEQAMAQHEVTPATDVWAVGVIFYEAVAGKLPFAGVNPGRQLDAIVQDEAAPLPGEVDARTRAVIARCLQKDPTLRYPDAGSLRVDLEHVLAALRAGGEDIDDADRDSMLLPRGALADPTHVAAEPPITRDERTPRQALARPKSPLIVAAFALALCAGAIHWARTRRAAPQRLDTGIGRIAKTRATTMQSATPRPKPETER